MRVMLAVMGRVRCRVAENSVSLAAVYHQDVLIAASLFLTRK
jgi:hypothetical protein